MSCGVYVTFSSAAVVLSCVAEWIEGAAGTAFSLVMVMWAVE